MPETHMITQHHLQDLSCYNYKETVLWTSRRKLIIQLYEEHYEGSFEHVFVLQLCLQDNRTHHLVYVLGSL